MIPTILGIVIVVITITILCFLGKILDRDETNIFYLMVEGIVVIIFIGVLLILLYLANRLGTYIIHLL